MEKQRGWPDGDGLSEAMDNAVAKIGGLAELMYCFDPDLDPPQERDFQGIALLLWETSNELREAYRSLCQQELEEAGEEAESA